MSKKQSSKPPKVVILKAADTEQNKNESTDETRFCLNCDDMDNLATGDDAADVKQAYDRYHQCRETGNFDGDICSRIFVADDRIDGDIMPSKEDDD